VPVMHLLPLSKGMLPTEHFCGLEYNELVCDIQQDPVPVPLGLLDDVTFCVALPMMLNGGRSGLPLQSDPGMYAAIDSTWCRYVDGKFQRFSCLKYLRELLCDIDPAFVASLSALD
jgi:hypothetical protein